MLPMYSVTPPGQPTRFVSFRDPGTRPKDLVVWIHGRDGSGENLISANTDPAPDRIDVGPNALHVPVPNNPKMWVTPGDAGDGMPMPSGVAPKDDGYDLRYFDTILAGIPSRFPSVSRIWVFGFSSGAKMTWGLSAYNASTVYPNLAHVRGYFKASHAPPYALQWPGRQKTPTPIGLWWGGVEPNPPDPRFPTFRETVTWAKELNGVTSMTRDRVVRADCCGTGKNIKVTQSKTGTPVARYVRVQGGHEITYCSGCKEYEFAIDFFRQNGFGS